MSSRPYPRSLVARPPIDPQEYKTFQPGRFNHIYLYDEDDHHDDADDTNNHDTLCPPRYHLRIVDRNDIPITRTINAAGRSTIKTQNSTNTTIQYPCAVFLIPAGREIDYTFTKYPGLVHVAQSASCARLIAVAFHRNHVYDNPQVVQTELEYIVQVIAAQQQGTYSSSSSSEIIGSGSSSWPSSVLATIPFMAMNGIGKRNIIAQGESRTTGTYIVEEVEVLESQSTSSSSSTTTRTDDRTYVSRRLFFLQNENVIQTQVFMTRVKTNSNMDSEEASSSLILDVESLAFDYHRHIAMGLVALGTFPITTNTSSISTSSSTTFCHSQGIVIGLGGGGLLNFLKVFFPHVAWIVIELDSSIVEIAKLYFGFQEDEQRLKVCIGDGLSITCHPHKDEEEEDVHSKSHSTGANQDKIHNSIIQLLTTPNDNKLHFEESSINFLIIDVDCKDVTVGMSCPPESFINIEYLTRLYDLLKEDGVLAINVSARDPLMLDKVLDHVQKVFQSTNIFIHTSTSDVDNHRDGSENEEKEDDDELNTVVFCKKCTTTKGKYILPTPSELKRKLLRVCQENQMIYSRRMGDWEESMLGIKEYTHWRRRVSDLETDILNMSVDKVTPKCKKKKKNKKK